jgi:hypothetical protein
VTHLTRRFIGLALITIAACAASSVSAQITILSSGSVGDRVWWDVDGDGQQAVDVFGRYAEPGIDGAVVQLTHDSNWDGIIGDTAYYNGVLMPDTVLVQTTRPVVAPSGLVVSGYYSFGGLGPGRYQVKVSSLPGGPWQQTYDYDDSDGWRTGVFTSPSMVACFTLGAPATCQMGRDGNLVSGLTVDSAACLDFGYELLEVGLPPGRFTTYTQGGWGAKPAGKNPGRLLADRFAAVCPTGLVVGLGMTITFTRASDVEAYLPHGGKEAGRSLRRCYTNPKQTPEAGVLAGQTVALKLNVDFSNAGVTRSGLRYLQVTQGPLQGLSVAEVLTYCELALGGFRVPYTCSQLAEAATGINENYDSGKTDRGFLTL